MNKGQILDAFAKTLKHLIEKGRYHFSIIEY